MTEYEEMTVAQLKDVLRERGLPVSGRKAELIERLQEAPEEEAPEATDEDIDDFDEDFDADDEFFDDEWDDFHVARQKPVLDESTISDIEILNAQKKKQPAFRRQEWFRYRRLSKTGWRKPKGMHSKQRTNRKYRAPVARIGYRKIASVRGLHPSGFEEVLIHKPGELEGIDPERQAVRIGSRVGNRKRMQIHDRADDLGLRILNRRRIERRGDLL
ncbi:50S ribosomal protein L32e [Candidatus Thalassarchaeum betae]|uniref:50S ribosomal protein L32e n=1 Tax=Candidatus Thalassarchaeum betae TaxID=2599289 RepID=UPI0030C74A9A|nr:50S ribosomal protein L32e [Candidatus Thalassoarchaea betae]